MDSKYTEIVLHVLDQIYISASVFLTAFAHAPLNLTFSGRDCIPSQAFLCLKLHFSISELRCWSSLSAATLEMPSHLKLPSPVPSLKVIFLILKCELSFFLHNIPDVDF